MPRYLSRSSRTTGQLREQMLRQLESDGEKILKQMMAQFTDNLASQAENVLKSSLSGLTGDAGGSVGLDSLSATKLLSSALSYALSRPKTTRSTSESSRSQEMERQFKLSGSQIAAEAAINLARADKNS